MKEQIIHLKEIYKHDKDSFKRNWSIFKKQGKDCIEEFKNKETRKKQIPNLFTATRLFAPFFIIPSALSGNLLLTSLFTAGFAFTDACDGYYARKYNCQSEFGRELDPITDKLFAGSLLIPLIVINPVMIVNLLLEAVIAGINMHSRLNDNKPRTAIIGKVKTGMLSLTMLCSYIAMLTSINPTIISSLILATCGLQVVTAIKYYNNYRKEENIKKEAEKQEDIKSNESTKKEVKIKNKEKILTKDKDTDMEKISSLTAKDKIDMLKDLKCELKTSDDILVERNKVYEKK